jgi:BMFP domain-containing protein YqiC
MQTQNRFFDDLARMAGGTLGLLTGLRTEVEAMVRQQMQRLLGDMQLVSREEFEAVKEMAAKARVEQEAAEKRLAVLESALAKNPGTRRD